MSKNMWIVAGLIAVVIAIVLWFVMKSGASPATSAPVAQTSETSSGNLAALVARGTTVQCDVNHGSGSDMTKGTVYVSGKKVRGDFESTVQQVGAVESHMISDGEYIYVWSSMMPTGMKMKASATSESSPGTANSAANLYGQNYDYNCKPWGADSSKFDLPAGITFNDMSAMQGPRPPINGSASGSATAPAPNCAMCDQAPASARAQCRAALGCK